MASSYTTIGSKAVWEYDEEGNAHQVGSIPITTTYTTVAGNTIVTQTDTSGNILGTTQLIRTGSSGSGSIGGITGGTTLVQDTTPTQIQPREPVFSVNTIRETEPVQPQSYNIGYSPQSYMPGYEPNRSILTVDRLRTISAQNSLEKQRIETNANRSIIPSPIGGLKSAYEENFVLRTQKELIKSPSYVDKGLGIAITPLALYNLGVEGVVRTSSFLYRDPIGSVYSRPNTNQPKFVPTSFAYIPYPQMQFKSNGNRDEFLQYQDFIYSNEGKQSLRFYRTSVAEQNQVGWNPLTWINVPAEFNQGFASSKENQLALKNTENFLRQKGYSEYDVSKYSGYVQREFNAYNKGELTGVLVVESVSNKIGSIISSTMSTKLANMGVRQTANTYVTNVAISRFIPGTIEGATGYDFLNRRYNAKSEGKDVLFWSVAGGVFASVSDVIINIPKIKQIKKLPITKRDIVFSKISQGGVYLTDLGEYPGDLISDTLSSGKVKINTMVNVPINTRTYTNSNVYTPSNSFTNVFANTNIKNNVNPYTNIFTNVDIFTNVRTNNNIITNANTNVNTNVNSNVFSNVFSNTNTNVNVNTPKNLPFFVPPLRGGGSGGFGFNVKTKQRKAYIPSLTAIGLGIKAKKGRKIDVGSGLSVRPII